MVLHHRLRAPTALWVAMHLVAALFAAVLDSRLPAGDDVSRAHIEEPGGSGCPPVHHADCGVCKQVSVAGVVAQSHTVLFSAAGTAPAWRTASVVLDARLAGWHRPRSPPAYS